MPRSRRGSRIFDLAADRFAEPAGMTTALMTLEVRNRQEWRMWLEKHHASSPDTCGQAARNAGEAHSGIDCSADGRKKAGLEVSP